MTLFSRFRSDRRGNVAILFSLAILPVMGAAGVALDYSRASATRAALQNAADATALSMVIARKKGQSPDLQALFRANLKSKYAIQNLSVRGNWVQGNDRFRIKADGSLPTTIASLLQPTIDIGVAATAEAIQNHVEIEIEGANLSPEAADYNELNAYCFNPITGQRLGPIADPKTGRRGPFLKIADNTDEGVARAPSHLKVTCGERETVSLHLKNVRHARTDPARRLTGETWNHYTDTTIPQSGPRAGVPQFNTQYTQLIETVLCETKAVCKPRSQGGVIPDRQTDRAPLVNDRPCQPGQYIYTGWEDRPPFIGQWTDRDYDDIRLVVKCGGSVGEPLRARLVS